MHLSCLFPQNTIPSKLEKKTFSEREKINLKNGSVFLHLEENTALDSATDESRTFLVSNVTSSEKFLLLL